MWNLGTCLPPASALRGPRVDVLAEAVGEVEEARELQEDECRVARQAGADPPLVQLILRNNVACENTTPLLCL